jgi:hypothetical protein
VGPKLIRDRPHQDHQPGPELVPRWGLLSLLKPPARIAVLGWNAYHANLVRKMMDVQPAEWGLHSPLQV